MSDATPNFVRLSRPAQPVVTLHAEPTEHGAKPASMGNFVRLSRPSPPVVLHGERVENVALVLEVEDANGAPGSVRDRLLNLLRAVNEYEKAVGGAGVECRVEAENGRLTLRLVPNDPAGARERLTKLADLIAKAMPDRSVSRRFAGVA